MNIHTRKLALASAISLALMTSAGGLAATSPSEDITAARQESQILTTYALNTHLQAHDLKVTLDQGVATLTGKVHEEVSKELAQQIALGVSGVDEVDNRIEVDADYQAPKPSSERSYGDRVGDASITAAVKSKLLWSKHAEGLSANVETLAGTVTLLGTATSSEAKAMAGLLASNTRGVKTVENQLKVGKAEDTLVEDAKEEAADLGQQISDSWITTKVKSTLFYTSNVDGSDISVTTKDGVVTLSGTVANGSEHDLAVELARNIRGVASVNAKQLNPS